MNITTENEALAELIAIGSSTDKRYKKLPRSAVQGFLKAYNIMRVANRIEDLFRYKGLNYERLNGTKFESVRCDIKYRLIFTSSVSDDTLVVKDIELIEISKHYGDN